MDGFDEKALAERSENSGKEEARHVRERSCWRGSRCLRKLRRARSKSP